MTGRSTFGSVRKRASGRWEASYWHEGERHVGPVTYATKADASAWLATVRADILRGAWIDPDAGSVTLADYANHWLEERHDLAETTKALYRYLLDRHVLPALGANQLSSLSRSGIRSWNAAIGKAHPTTAAKAYRLLAAILKTAVEDDYLVKSPCRVKGAATETAPERPVASIAEVQALADAVPEHLRIAILLAAWCQLRLGEVLGLRRKDVDLLHGTLSVEITRTKTMGGKWITKSPKTQAGARTISVPPNVLPLLEHHLGTQVGRGSDAALIEGGYRPLRTAWDNARRKTGLAYRFHDLRHAGLTWSAATGATPAELMHRAGHKSNAAALRYQHATKDRDQALAAALAALAPVAEVVPIRTDAAE